MNCHSFILLLSFVAVATGNKYTGCIGSSCCPDRMELYPGDSVTLKREGSGGGWCGHEFLVRLEDTVCDGCSFTVEFDDFSTPFTPSIDLSETNYTQMLFYGSTFQSFSTFASYGGENGKAVPSSVVTTGNVLKIDFGNTDGYSGELSVTVTTKTSYGADGVYVAIGVSVVSFLIIAAVVAIVVVRRRRRLARLRGPVLITAVSY